MSFLDPSDLSVKNAHCWHTSEVFSKFDFGAGAYDSQDFSNTSEMATTRDYVTAIAISSMRLGNTELANFARNDSAAKEPRSWQRLKPLAKMETAVLEENAPSKSHP